RGERSARPRHPGHGGRGWSDGRGGSAARTREPVGRSPSAGGTGPASAAVRNEDMATHTKRTARTTAVTAAALMFLGTASAAVAGPAETPRQPPSAAQVEAPVTETA